MDQVQANLIDGRDRGVSSWVVDLTGNTGGSSPIMLASIGPLLENDVHGYFLDSDDGAIIWGMITKKPTLGIEIMYLLPSVIQLTLLILT